jgi:hypothetical protein
MAKRGRPPYDFFMDPERFVIAFVDALTACGISETDAYKYAATQIIGHPVEARILPPRRKRGRGLVPGGPAQTYEGPADPGGDPDDRALSIERKGAALRRKFKDKHMATREITAWRRSMKRAFLLVFDTRKEQNPDRCRAQFRRLMTIAHEESYGRNCLGPLLELSLIFENICLRGISPRRSG